MSVRSRELSQFGSFINVNDSPTHIGITSTSSSPFVGVGTNNPISKLHVIGNVNVSGSVTATSFIGDGSGLTNIAIAGEYTQWKTTAAGIHTSSNVGIGSTIPTSKLDVIGNVNISGAITASTFYGDGSELTGLSPSKWDSGASGIHTSSNVGIGTTNPTSKLQVVGDANVSGVITATAFYGDGSNLINLQGRTQWDSGASGIHTSSNVGIGTTNPTSKLQVVGDANISGVVTATSFVGNGSGLVGIVATNSGVEVRNNDSILGTASTINFTSNIQASFLNGTATITNTKPSQFEVTSIGIHTLSNTGIGTTNPTSKLTVTGDALITGVITASSFSGNATSATSADYATSAGSASVATNLANAANITTGTINSARLSGSYTINIAGTATTATNVVGGIGSISQLRVTGLSTFTNGPVLIGSATSTGTASQPLQITGGAYFSGNVGIGTTRPTSSLSVIGNVDVTGISTFRSTANISGGAIVTGVVTATSFSGSGSNLTTLNASEVTSGILPAGVGVTAGASSASFVRYNGTTRTAGQFDGGTNNPLSNTRLNYNGDFYSTNFYASSALFGRQINLSEVSGNTAIFNRDTTTGQIAAFQYNAVTQGTIAVASDGTTINYNTFLGSHWSMLSSGEIENIPVGTIMETVNELTEWKLIVFNKDNQELKMCYNGSLPVGITTEINYEGNNYIGTIVKEQPDLNMEKSVRVKVSDVAGSSAVFGVFLDWNNEDDQYIGNWNTMNVASLGNYFIRMNGGEEVEIGDLIESAGNGCGRVQGDDIIRSKTVGKITSTIKQKIYDDGSYLVTAVLYCG